MKGIWKFLGTVGIAMFMSVLASAYTQQGRQITCDDGRVLMASPFGDPALMCGERENVRVVPEIDPEFTALYGDSPTRENTGLSGKALRRARFSWKWTYEKWGGVVSPMDVLDPENAANPEAVKSAIETGQLNEEWFNADRVAQVEAWFVEYELGVPIYTLRQGVKHNPDGEPIKGYLLSVKFAKLSPTFGLNEQITLQYPQIGIANGQIRMIQSGICFDKVIAILKLPGNTPCTEE